MQSDTIVNKSKSKKNQNGASMDMIDDSTTTVATTTENQLYKTEICRNWEEQGTCRYGNNCQYAHGDNDLRYIKRHPRYKTIHCKTFESTGVCSYGRRCTFLHEQTSLPRGHQHQVTRLNQITPSFTSVLSMDSNGNNTSSETTMSTYSPPLGPIFTTSTMTSSPPQSSYNLLPKQLTPTTSSSLLQNQQQYSYHVPNYMDQGQQLYGTKSELRLSKELFTDTGGFSCAFGLSPPLLSPSNSNIPSYFSPSSSTATASSSSSSAASKNFILDSNHHFYH